MQGSTPEQGFVSISNLVAEVLYAINDAEDKKYYARTLQNVLNKLRNVNVHYGRLYKETPIDLDSDLRSGKYPTDLVKPITVGIYRNGEFWSFTRKPNMAKTVTGDGEAFDEDFKEAEDIPSRGVLFSARGQNVGYWVEDDENCRFFVRNYEETKVILRYRSNGITCTTENCVPYKLKDLIVAMVVYDFALNRIPTRFTGVELELKRLERSRHYDEFTDLEYIPQDMDEFMDAQFASSNLAPKRGL
jgi:hypothetical protein